MPKLKLARYIVAGVFTLLVIISWIPIFRLISADDLHSLGEGAFFIITIIIGFIITDLLAIAGYFVGKVFGIVSGVLTFLFNATCLGFALMFMGLITAFGGYMVWEMFGPYVGLYTGLRALFDVGMIVLCAIEIAKANKAKRMARQQNVGYSVLPPNVGNNIPMYPQNGNNQPPYNPYRR